MKWSARGVAAMPHDGPLQPLVRRLAQFPAHGANAPEARALWLTMSAAFAIAATVCAVTPRCLQYGDSNQTASGLAPLLELQPAQHRAMFSLVTMRASLMMCSQVATALREMLESAAFAMSTPQ
jgi:hypothetical protein